MRRRLHGTFDSNGSRSEGGKFVTEAMGTLCALRVSNVSDTRVPERGRCNGILNGRRWLVFDRTKDERHSPD
ncbi:hypothetical protein SBA7_200007 [Candidatus Sulfotelmatobacter sp. SbA7]|nr:hypothetical protein SBA7_200007 [Candidatus Sulfotelmatobacter sp. SbA7]